MIWLLSAAWARPPSFDSIDSAEGHIRCHVGAEADTPRCEDVVVWAEEAWAAQVDRIGFPAPLSDGALGGSPALDIYLSRFAGGANIAWVTCDVNGDCIDSDSTDDRTTTPAYIVIDPRTDEALFRSYVHHEFSHTYQYGMDYTEPFLSLWEGTAVATEHWTDPTWTTSADDFGDYQATPWLSPILQDGYLLADLGVNDDSWYEYGAVAWIFFMDAHYGDGAGSIAPALWEEAAGPGKTVLDAWEAVSGDWRESLLELTVERARMGRAGGPDWAAFAGDKALALREGVIQPDGEWWPRSPPYPQGVSYFDLPVDFQPALVSLDGDPEVDWALLAITADGWSRLDPEGSTLNAEETITIAVVNLGAPDFSATDSLVTSSFSLRVRPGSTDGDDPGGAYEGGVGCHTAPGPRYPFGLGLVLALWTGRRARSRHPGGRQSPS